MPVKSSKYIALSFLAFLLISCSGESVKPNAQTSEKKVDLLTESANKMVEERGLDLFKIKEHGKGTKYDIEEAKNYREVDIFTWPEAVGNRLCKLRQYKFKAFRVARGYRWKPVENTDDGLMSIFSSVVENTNTKRCSQTVLADYFDTPDTIENNTLVSLYSSLDSQLKNGSIRLINKNDYKIKAIQLFDSSGLNSDGYMALVDTEVPKSTYSVHMRYNNGKFVLVKVSLLR